MKKCPKCGTECTDDLKTCSECGNSLDVTQEPKRKNIFNTGGSASRAYSGWV